ncbi:catalase family protein [Acinetobacter venetianus]|uniref:catalase family protein n=1 Tax=Acinetobacter venetianus TaxID=52133 RepID=UPI00241C95D6|nr:catalase family protein [Acinetobacter venetianus]
MFYQKYIIPLFVFSSVFIAVSGCSEEIYQKPPLSTFKNNETKIPYPQIDQDLGEKLQPNEALLAQEISKTIEQTIRTQYQNGHALRDAHPKAHGCVQAEFQVLNDIPKQLAQGVFIPNKTYQAWIRFSNASGDATQADNKKDARGIAIKILGVAGKKILESNPQATTQDFIMINHPVFFVNDAKRYLSFTKHISGDHFTDKIQVPFALGIKGTINALGARNSLIANPIQARYWSMVPYQLGIGENRQAVKYSVRACQPEKATIPKNAEPNFLRSALKDTLAHQDACMEFLIQPRTSNKMLIEDSMTEWKESEAPFYHIATIHIPQQNFDTAKQNEFCENLSFTPWHALPEHRPLGAINRLRKVIYEDISRVRHEMNAAPRQEPN